VGLSPGDRVDRYEVLELLGAGGMGEVYRARDPKLARLVALKIVRLDGGLGTDGPARLLREARAAAALSHANVLAVFDVGEVQEPAALRGLAYIAMELVVGRSLRTYLGDEDVPIERRVGWLRDVANALGAAHAAGIVHRDVKPENVMVRHDGVVKVLDFGIARRNATPFDAWSSTEGHSLPTAATGSLGATMSTQPGTVVGTPLFMAPEQLRGEPLDGRADQFAWGVLAYALLTGGPPWKGLAEPLAVLSQILSLDPPPARDLNPRIPLAVSDVIVRALQKRREARFDTMGDLVRALDAVPVDTGARHPPAPPPPAQVASSASPAIDPSPTQSRGGRGIARLAVGTAVLVVGVSALFVWRGRSQRPAARAVAPGGSGIEPAAAGACSSNRACVEEHGGGAWRCHSQRHVCVEIASTDCKTYAQPHDAEADDVVWIGGMFPLDPAMGFLSEMRAAELAREDFAQALGPSAARAGGLHARPIGFVACDEGGDPARAARHLAEDVEVPAVIGFRSGATIPSVFLPHRALAVVSINQATAITKIPEPPGEPRLVWRSTLNENDFAVAIAHLIPAVLEPAARAAPNGIGSRPYKVAVVWPAGTNRDFIDAFFEALRFNDRSALENGSSFRQFAFGAEAAAGHADAAADTVIDDLLAFAPQAIVYAGDTFYPDVLVPLEARWPRGLRPVYLTGSTFGPAVAAFAGRDPTRRRRFFAVTNLATTMTNARLVLRYNLAFPGEPVVRSEAPQPSYDAFYMLAYAVYALGDQAISGPALSNAFQRLLPPGRKVDVGFAQILEAFETLRSAPDARIDLNGALGSLDFDPATGEAPVDYSVICPGVDDRGAASAPVDSGLVYDATTKKVTGTLRCP
jgi:serine/threonine-protein kinase